MLIAICDPSGRYLRAATVEAAPEGAVVLPDGHDLDEYRDRGRAPRWDGAAWIFDAKEKPGEALDQQPSASLAFAKLIDALEAKGIDLPPETQAWRKWFAASVDSMEQR